MALPRQTLRLLFSCDTLEEALEPMKQAMDLHRCAPSLVPELIVSSLATSLSFWCDIVGFTVRYDRPEEGFAYIALGHAHVMLEQRSQATRDWSNGDLIRPYGRGINLQIEVPDFAALIERCTDFDMRYFVPPEERWYRRNQTEVGQRQCILSDPDGYLARLVQTLGERPIADK